jgi:hypothetical protein
MAKMQLGIVATDIRGSVGGTVFSRNKGGAYTRKRVAPINRTTPKQTQVRNNFGLLSKAWGASASDPQRGAWSMFAQANPLVNVLGASIIISGNAMFNKLNQRLLQIGAATILDPPADLSVPVLASATGLNITAAGGLVIVDTNVQAVEAGALYYIFATPPLAPGRTPQQSDYRFLGKYAAVAAAVSISLTTDYAAAYGAFPAGAVIGVDVSTINVASGAVTPGLIFNTAAS